MPIKYAGDAEELIKQVTRFIRHSYPRASTSINGCILLWPKCEKDTLKIQVDNLPSASGIRKVLAHGITFCVEFLEDDEPTDRRTHLPVKEVRFKSRHLEITLDRSKVGKRHFV